MIGVGSVPPAQSQLAKFAGVQDRLRDWRPDTLAKLKHFSCMEISMLDIDGFRMDKALQTTIDSNAEWSQYVRECAKGYGKDNFLITGESIGEMPFGAVYFGRGKQPDMAFDNLTEAQLASDTTNSSTYIREFGLSALDGEAFHYPTYGALTRFLGLDGEIGLTGIDFVNLWHTMLSTNDMVNAATGKFDPRHMYGVTNQDVFRWPGLANGTQRQNLGFFVTIIEMPGIPMLMWGEEQGHKALENIAPNYIFGRAPMASSRAWQMHGCYKLGAAGNGYYNLPLDSANETCSDDSVSLDHRDPSHPLRNILKRMYEIRQQYPAINDGFTLETLSTQLVDLHLPGSGIIATPTGLWSVYRGRTEGVQDFTDGQGNQGAWLLMSNDNTTREYTCDCGASNSNGTILAPFPLGTTVKNLFYPYEELVLNASTARMGIENSTELNGCLPNLTMPAWGYKAFVPVDKFVVPGPTITKLDPGHDTRLLATVPLGEQQSVPFEVQFSREMDCQSVLRGITVESTTEDGTTMRLDDSSVSCASMAGAASDLIAAPVSAWSFSATLTNVSHGVHTIILSNVTTAAAGDSNTIAVDRYMFRLGAANNPIVFPSTANYTSGTLRQDRNGSLFYNKTAAGAELWRYSTNWGTTYSDWMAYDAGESLVELQAWSGTEGQAWYGTHVISQYWGDMVGSSDHIQHTDLGDMLPRRWPQAHVQGEWNQFGFDGGLNDSMVLGADGWSFDLMQEWPSYYSINIWGMNPDGMPDKTMAYGDVDGDNILDNLPPNTLAQNTINVTEGPSMPHVGYRLLIDDGSYRYTLQPTGSAWSQIAIFVLLCLVPILSGTAAVVTFMKSFYQIKFNELGLAKSVPEFPRPIAAFLGRFRRSAPTPKPAPAPVDLDVIGTAALNLNSRTVLIGTMEYDIEDWKIKIKIGGLGVMASLMGKNLGHQNLIWVVPCVGGVDYPTDTPANPMIVTVMGAMYEISVQYHRLRNITYVLLDAPVFRKQTKAEPYPPRMDDIESAVYYSAWNQCIAQTIVRFPEIDLYHINDYHGAVAPLYLLPRRIPCCLSLHNAEFQGLWSVSTPERMNEICRAFNLEKKVVKSYVQFGEVFNLLHSGASILRKHQNGFGAVGVSKKYGKRSYARYPIFWGLNKIGALPNPDPSDVAEFDKMLPRADVPIDDEAEAQRGPLRREAQKWAGLKVDETAELFVFVGRWSKQKGVDVIADVLPAILKENKKVQLICVGPVIDLYGKFAALKLQSLMEMYPDRVYSKPEFTALPPYLFSGAEFALIPSRDEPFGLVAVEFGRKGALGVGSRVGGLGQMPGWWFTIESTATKHMIGQFKGAIKGALASSQKTRALMRARSSLQRFPVAQWIEDLEILQTTSIKNFKKVEDKRKQASTLSYASDGGSYDGLPSFPGSMPVTAPPSRPASTLVSPTESRAASRAPSRPRSRAASRNHSPTRDSYASSQWQALHSRLSAVNRNMSSGTTSLNNLGDVSAADFAHSRLFPIESRGNILDQAESASSEDGDAVHMAPESPRFDRPPATMNYSYTRASSIASPSASGTATPIAYGAGLGNPLIRASALSLQSVVGEQKNLKLQDVDPSFTDANGFYTRRFENMLRDLDAKTSEGSLCIEDYINKSEKNWFARYADAKLGKSGASASKLPLLAQWSTPSDGSASAMETDKEEFALGEGYKPPSGPRKWLMTKVGDWPIYALLLAFGQIIAANSYQITLLSGQNGQSANMLYSIASIYLVSSVAWWTLFRYVESVYVLSLPFLFYGAAFFILGMTPYGPSMYGRGWIQNVATGLYAIASASGALFFALNFGSEGGTPSQTWVFRACVIQGTQQIYVAVLWFWGAYLTDLSSAGVQTSEMLTSTPIVTAITTPIAIFLWAIGLLLLLGLPNYYRSSPGKVPSFYPSLYRRKVVLWFFIAVVIQNFWLSAPYGRNWRFLWSSSVCPQWAIAIEVMVFFIFIWAAVLLILGQLSREHSWLVPLFAMGLGAPRWCQMLWGTSGMGNYLPWASTPLIGVLVGRGLWLWLGMLDALQGIGFGMILLQTLTRFHITFALIAGQILGSIATIAARAGAPDNVGPGSVFPNLALSTSGLDGPWFWVAMGFQLIVPIGFFVFFRKEQLFKP